MRKLLELNDDSVYLSSFCDMGGKLRRKEIVYFLYKPTIFVNYLLNIELL